MNNTTMIDMAALSAFPPGRKFMPGAYAPSATLAGVLRVVEQISRQVDVDGVVDAALNGLRGELGMRHVLFVWEADGADRLAMSYSQIMMAISVRGEVRGKLCAMSFTPYAFSGEDEAGLALIAAHVGATLALIEAQSARSVPVALAVVPRGSRIVYYRYDDSIFIDGRYAIKGVAGRLLYYMLEQHQQSGRTAFSNREIRLAMQTHLPDEKDNLETRLLLLRRRLDEKDFPVRLLRSGRGCLALQLDGQPCLNAVDDARASQRAF